MFGSGWFVLWRSHLSGVVVIVTSRSEAAWAIGQAARCMTSLGWWLTLTLVATAARAQPPRNTPAAVQRYFDLVRPMFSAQRAYDQVAFMDRYFRWPGNTGFNASIHRVEEILKAAGYVEESTARPTDVLTYRIEHRPCVRRHGSRSTRA